MTAALLLLLTVAFGTSARAEGSESGTEPSYTAASIVNATTNAPGPFAPNSIVTIYGTNLAFGEEAASAANIRNRQLPVKLAGVWVLNVRGGGGVQLPLHYVGPRQINFVLPDSLDPGTVDIRVVRSGIAGPIVTLTLQEAAPELFPGVDDTAIATHADGSVVTAADPARPGKVVVLYCTGLGRTVQRLEDGEIPEVPPFPLEGLFLKNLADLRVLVAGQPIETERILYAGLTPGIAALYQINVKLPEMLPENPEIRLAVGERLSREGLWLPVTLTPAEPEP